MNNQDVQEEFESGERIDRAMDRAFLEAVRLYGLHAVPIGAGGVGAGGGRHQ
jgi:hypothetical protein